LKAGGSEIDWKILSPKVVIHPRRKRILAVTAAFPALAPE